MPSLDGDYDPFLDYPGYRAMAPCMRSCEDAAYYNGCDNSGCWCTKPNLDRRISNVQRCASTECTFENMNTETDLSVLSTIQVQYCVDMNRSPAGMTLPSTAKASTTASSPSDTSSTGISATGVLTDSTIATRTRPTSSSTPTSDLGSSNPPIPSNNASSGMSTAAKAGIAIGSIFCILLAILIVVVLRRRKQQPHPPQQISTMPFSGNDPRDPPSLQQPAPLQIPNNGVLTGIRADVSPIDEKAPAVGITRKEVGSGAFKHDISPQGTPALRSVQPASLAPPSSAPTEFPGSIPPIRHEVHSDGEITHSILSHGTELDSHQYSAGTGRPMYAESGQGQWANQSQGGFDVQQYGGAYELGTGK